MNSIDLLYNWVLPIIMLILGLIGNSFSFIIFSSKKMKKFSSVNSYKTLALMDSLYLIFRIIESILINNNSNLRTLSSFSCQFVSYLNPAFGPISSWLLVYISIERFITISFPKITIIKKTYFELIITMLIFIYNLGYNLPFLIYSSLKLDKSFNQTSNTTLIYKCVFQTRDLANSIMIMDLINLF